MSHQENPSPRAQLDLLEQQRAHVLDRSGLPLWVLAGAGLVFSGFAVVWAYRPGLVGLGLVPLVLHLGLTRLQRRRGVGEVRADPYVWVRAIAWALLIIVLAIAARALASLDAPWPVVVLAAVAAGAAYAGSSLLDQTARRRFQDAAQGRR